MKYQLVLQTRGESLAAFDTMMKVEQDLVLELGDIALVDGHDMGCNEINIFIITSNPLLVFARSKPVLERHGLLAGINSAFRLLSGETYTRVWPQGSTNLFSIA